MICPHCQWTHDHFHADKPHVQHGTTSDEMNDLMRDWIRAECSIISEFSGNFEASVTSFVTRARGRATKLGLSWQESWVPSWARDYLRETSE